MKNSLSFRKGDLLAIALVVFLAACTAGAFAAKTDLEKAAVAQIYQDGQMVKEIPLEQDQTFAIAGEYTNTIAVRDGRIAIEASDCPGEDCVHSGWISSPGRSIVCLPNRVEIRITGEPDVDFVVGQ